LAVARRHMPGDELLAVAGLEHDLLGLRHAGVGRADAGRDRMVEHRALHHVEQRHQHHVARDPDDQYPTDDRHTMLFLVRKCHGLLNLDRGNPRDPSTRDGMTARRAPGYSSSVLRIHCPRIKEPAWPIRPNASVSSSPAWST